MSLQDASHPYWATMLECAGKADADHFYRMRAVAYHMHRAGVAATCFRWAELLGVAEPGLRGWLQLMVIDDATGRARRWEGGVSGRPYTRLRQSMSRWLRGEDPYRDPDGELAGLNCWFHQVPEGEGLPFETARAERLAWDDSCDLTKPWRPPWVYRRLAGRGVGQEEEDGLLRLVGLG